MTAIARELDEKLRTLDANTAASVEQLVRAALALAEKSRTPGERDAAIAEHRQFISQFAGLFENEPFDRPSQGEHEKRDTW